MNKEITSLSSECIEAFKSANASSNVRSLKYQIVDESFSLVATQPATDSLPNDFDQISALLEPGAASLIVVRLEKDIWVLVAWVPDDTQVKDKMIYASSRTVLKSGLGGSMFRTDYFVSEASECSWEAYCKANDKALIEATRSEEEKDHAEHGMVYLSNIKEIKMAGMKALHIDCDESVWEAIGAIQAKEKSFAVFEVVFGEKETLTASKLSDGGIEELREGFHDEKPCYALFNWSHVAPGRDSAEVKTIFVYFCPDNAAPKKKMTYSTVSKNLSDACGSVGLEVSRRFEISEGSEMSEEELVRSLYPKEEKIESFARPARPGKGKARLRKK